ncbi:hypothetical protein PYW08_009238 [Mythimna loreyi]|uniref:Uncharacterized protein n=1 Tax=Mythimna loreyi TaxID=667449 RepID=A0ACC2QAI8_9NEOP|nr:hypothetical protein PYW08_009238 [Mythimna loreyi]
MALSIFVLLVLATTTSAISNEASKLSNPSNTMNVSFVDFGAADQKLAKSDVFVETRSNLNIGKISKGDKLLTNGTYIKKPCPDKVHVQDIVIKGSTKLEITAIKVTEVGETQNGEASIKEGGVGKNFVVIRLQSAKGCGYHYVTEVWGAKLKKSKDKSQRGKPKSLILISSHMKWNNSSSDFS